MRSRLTHRHVSIALIAGSISVTLICCVFQFVHYRRLSPVDISRIPVISADCHISDISWKDTDYDYLEGYISIEGEPVTKYNTRVVFYRDGEDTAYVLPLKVRNYIEPEREQQYADEKDLRDFIYVDKEYVTNAAEPSSESYFYCLVHRDNDLRNNTHIGFLMNIDGEACMVKTGEPYKYFGID